MDFECGGHVADDDECPRVLAWYPWLCKCGGHVHAEFGDYTGVEGGYYLEHCCDRCGATSAPDRGGHAPALATCSCACWLRPNKWPPDAPPFPRGVAARPAGTWRTPRKPRSPRVREKPTTTPDGPAPGPPPGPPNRRNRA